MKYLFMETAIHGSNCTAWVYNLKNKVKLSAEAACGGVL